MLKFVPSELSEARWVLIILDVVRIALWAQFAKQTAKRSECKLGILDFISVYIQNLTPA